MQQKTLLLLDEIFITKSKRDRQTNQDKKMYKSQSENLSLRRARVTFFQLFSRSSRTAENPIKPAVCVFAAELVSQAKESAQSCACHLPIRVKEILVGGSSLSPAER